MLIFRIFKRHKGGKITIDKYKSSDRTPFNGQNLSDCMCMVDSSDKYLKLEQVKLMNEKSQRINKLILSSINIVLNTKIEFRL